MSFFKRLFRVIKANLNALISRAEKPEKILDQVLLEMQQQLQEAQHRVSHSIADEKKLKKQLQEEERQSEVWEKRAIHALEVEDDDLAKQALARKAEHDQMAEELYVQWEKQKLAVEQLKSALHLLKQKIEDASRQRNLLLARQKRAQAQQMLQETMAGVSENSAFDTLERMKQKIEAMEAQVEAQSELHHDISTDALEARFRQLESQKDAQVDALAALKARMGRVSTPERVPTPEKEKQREAVPVSRDENW